MTKKFIFVLYIFVWGTMFLGVIDYQKIIEAWNQSQDFKAIVEILINGLDVGSAVALAVLAGIAYKGIQRDDDWITVVLCYPDGKEERINDAFQREECSRGEVNGILGAYHGPGRYDVSHMRSAKLRADIKKIKSSKALEIKVPLTLSDHFKGIEKLQPKTPDTSAQTPDERPQVFWNISNHPVKSAWSSEQQEAALKVIPDAEITQIIDMGFPEVNPAWSYDEVQAEAQRIGKSWQSHLSGEYRVVAVLVAGEPLMCTALVQILESHNIQCYTATTQRITTVVEGEKHSRFEFVRFRSWSA
jgi:hypothetical protein